MTILTLRFPRQDLTLITADPLMRPYPVAILGAYD